MASDKSRTHNTILNLSTTALVYIVTLGMSLLVRFFLNRTLGTRYVGLNGVLTSVITSLSLADLGIDSVFVYLLYKPLAEGDLVQASSLMRLFRKVYIYIGSFFIFAGTIAIPFLHVIIGREAMVIPHVKLIYFIFMLNTGLSYFFAYYRIVLNADQKYYVIARITFLFTLFTNILQIFLLLTVDSFLVYVVLLLLCTVAINLCIGWLVRHRYSFSKGHVSSDGTLEKGTISTLLKNTVGGISNKVGTIVVVSSDNILLANFTDLNVVGMYSNYILITQGLASFLSKIISSITATIGNLGTEQNTDRNMSVFQRISFAMNILVISGLLPLELIFSLFVGAWAGESSVLPKTSVVLIVVNAMLQLVRYPSLTFIDAFGLQWVQKWKSVVESVCNVFVSLVLMIVFRMGLDGVLLGTLCSNLFVVNWFEPYIVLKYACGGKYLEYIRANLPFLLIFVTEVLVGAFLLKMQAFQSPSYSTVFAIVGVIVIQVAVIFVIFRRSSSFQYYMQLAKSFFKK